jgi:hypothetical protein
LNSVSQPPIARISDVVGRVETYCICISLYVIGSSRLAGFVGLSQLLTRLFAIGYIIVASSTSIYMYAAGNSIYSKSCSALLA